MNDPLGGSYGVTITGAGLAGLPLARHKGPNPPGSRQKVDESLVQLSGFYLSKVLDLEDKYNLRFRCQAGRSVFDQLALEACSRCAVDDIHQTEEGFCLGAKPILVEGSILVQRLNTHDNKAEILMFDSTHVARGPAAVLSLPLMIHHGFQSSYE